MTDSSADPSSAASEEWTTDSLALVSDTLSSANPTSGDETSSLTTGPESLSTRTYVKSQKAHDPEDCERWEEAEAAPALDAAGHGPRTATLVFTQNQREEVRDLGDQAGALSGEGSHQTNYVLPALTKSQANGAMGHSNKDDQLLVLNDAISSREDSPARTFPSPGSGAGSLASDPDSSMSSHESLNLFDPDSFSSRTYPVSSLHTAVGTSEQSLERWPTSGMAWRGGLSTHVSSECRSDGDGCSSSEFSLTEILEPPQNVPAKYSLSERAASGILRRAEKRGRELPPHLRAALEGTAGTESA